MSRSTTATFEGTLGRTVFEAEGYSVVWFHPSDGSKAARMVFKAVPKPANASHVRIVASTRRHERYGDQLFAESVEQVSRPTASQGLARYLADNLEGVGVKTAEKIVQTFGEGTSEAMADVDRLATVLPRAVAERAVEQWGKLSAKNELFPFLHEHGFGPKLCDRIFEAYGPKALEVARTNPYSFIRVDGVGFLTADRLAMSIGYDPKADKRITAAIDYALSNVQGDVCMSQGKLAYETIRLLHPEGLAKAEEGLPLKIAQTIRSMLASDHLASWQAADGDLSLYHLGAARTEAKLADRLATICRARIPKLDAASVRKFVKGYEARMKLTFADQQKEGIAALHDASLVVVTGGPGTGKTTLLRAACDAYESLGLTIELAAPTGRAAKRMTELTGRPARTIHRLLEFSAEKGGFLRDTHNPIGREHSDACAEKKYKECSCDFHVPPTLLVVDESSMLDMSLATSLFEAIYYGTRVMLVGDVDQLPSVGPGAVLRDVIDSGVCKVIRLSHIYRQGHESSIPVASATIMQGESPSTSGDFFVVQPTLTMQYVVELVRRTARRIDKSPLDVQVLVPMKKGSFGMNALNAALQDAFNPATRDMEQLTLAGYALREGDKVIQLQNDYEKEVFNGEIGTVSSVTSDPFEVVVQYEGRDVSYGTREELDMLQLAYAMTIHKSQGSEYPAVLALALPEHWHMLSRNLIYTAVTRAKKLCIVLTDKEGRALAHACETKDSGRRTHLADRIREEIGKEDEEVEA